MKNFFPAAVGLVLTALMLPGCGQTNELAHARKVVKEGMTYDQVIAAAGQPHQTEPAKPDTKGTFTILWRHKTAAMLVEFKNGKVVKKKFMMVPQK